jgi:hypothetical protein
MTKRKPSKSDDVERALELARAHLLDMIKHPRKLDQIPSGATLVLFPVPIRAKKAA